MEEEQAAIERKIHGKEWLTKTHKECGIIPEVYNRWNDPKSNRFKKFQKDMSISDQI